MLAAHTDDRISNLFKVIGDPFRVCLLLALVDNEACVCHLERLLGRRQAFISQHLMSLREAGVLTARREGKYIFYRVKDRKLPGLILRAAEMAGLRRADLDTLPRKVNPANCKCPHCA